MIDLRFVPIVQWPGKPTNPRRNAAFRSTYHKTLDLLQSELKKISAREIMVQAFYDWDQIRNDGWPRANRSPRSPGVILTFKKPTGAPFTNAEGRRMVNVITLSFPCDTYHHYEHNLHAIALSLAALRAVDRYGVTRSSEQYEGWKQIAAPRTGGFENKEEAAEFIAREAGFVVAESHTLITNKDMRTMAYRDAAKRLHPESTHPNRTTDPALWDRLQKAISLLEAQ